MILIDTHVLLWLALGEERLSRAAVAAIHDARKHSVAIAVSDVSLWEISLAARKNRVPFTTTAASFLEEVERRFHILPITARASELAADLPKPFPKRPSR
jgi:PIN domain nuclease of toxin-antitoxin system